MEGMTMAEASKEAPKADPLKGLSQFEKAAFQSVTDDTLAHNEIVGQIQAATGDPQALLENLRQTSKDPKVLAENKKIDAANEALLAAETARDAILLVEVEKVRANVEGQVATLTAKADELHVKVNAGRGYLKKLVNADVMALLPTVASAKGKKSSGGGTGARRIRGYNVAIGGKKYDNVSAAAKDLGLDTEAIQGPFFTKVGDSRPDSVTVTVTVNGAETQATFSKV